MAAWVVPSPPATARMSTSCRAKSRSTSDISPTSSRRWCSRSGISAAAACSRGMPRLFCWLRGLLIRPILYTAARSTPAHEARGDGRCGFRLEQEMGDQAGEQKRRGPGGQNGRQEADLAKRDRGTIDDEEGKAKGEAAECQAGEFAGSPPGLAEGEGQAEDERSDEELGDPRVHPGGIELGGSLPIAFALLQIQEVGKGQFPGRARDQVQLLDLDLAAPQQACGVALPIGGGFVADDVLQEPAILNPLCARRVEPLGQLPLRVAAEDRDVVQPILLQALGRKAQNVAAAAQPDVAVVDSG